MFTAFIQLYKQAYKGLSRNSWLLSLVMLINRSGTMVVAFMSIYCVHSLHFTIEQAGIIMMLFGVGSICGGFIGGLLTDKIGFYDLQVVALFTGGIFFILLGFQHTFLTLAIGVVVLSLFNESVRPANSAAIAHYSTAENKTRSISLNRLAVNIGWATGSALGGFLASINYHLLFWVDGGTNILAAIMLLIVMPKSAIVKTIKKVKSAVVWYQVYFDSTYLLFILFGLFFFVCFYEFMIIEPAFYKLSWHFNESFIGFLMALNGLLIAFLEMVLIHNLEGKRNGLIYICFGVLLGGIGFVLLNLVHPTALMAIVIIVIITFSEMFAMPFMNSFWIGRSNEHNRGQYAALYSMSWSAAQIVAPLVGGIVIAGGGFSMLWWIFAAMCVFSAAGYYFMYKNRKENQDTSIILP